MTRTTRHEARIRQAVERATEGYNGWANYETWAVALWIDNDQGTHDARNEMVADAVAKAPTHDNVASGIWTEEQAARYELADTLKDWVSDELLPDLGASLAADLLGAALSEVDWNEMAETWLEDAKVQP